MSPELFMARRYLSSRDRPFSVKLLQGIGLIGVAVGVFSLVAVLAVMNGFRKTFEAKILGFQAPLTMEAAADQATLPAIQDLQKAHPEIVAGERWVEGELVIQSSFGTAAGAKIRGIEGGAETIRSVDHLYLPTQRGGRLQGEGEELPGIVLGAELAATLEVHPDFGDEVKLVFPFGDISPSGEMLPRVRQFRVTGIFESGFYEYDHKYAFVDSLMAERLFGEYGREKRALFLHDPLKAPMLKERLAQEGDYALFTWQERNRELFSALQLERVGMFLLLLMIVLIASFNIFALIAMRVLEKIRDVAVLRSLGLRLRAVRRLFLLQSTGIGTVGAAVGGCVGVIVCLWFSWFPYRLPPTYYVEFLPIRLELPFVLLALATGPLVGFLVGLYPARQATRAPIASVLRYE